MSWLHNLKTSVIFCIVLILLIFQSCDIFDSNQKELAPLEGNFLFCVVSDDKNQNSLEKIKVIVSIYTEKHYPCANFSIESKVRVFGNRITISFLGIGLDPYWICLPAFGPASARHSLQILPGAYELVFDNYGLKDKYMLTLRDSSVQIRKISSQFTQPNPLCPWTLSN
ncbi:MAG: hypothetical protein RBG1_1C00001G0695 [candidate division Zixibacteria bacterium RBG-1]|nr:MAG: hypothetical protein RBG1_1C00001G0695 [candidate division Zixibacteria bacterium RBG-1]OGC86163.1 MAG: hypothetical protein A2V73_07585 [candidate division Zixibacteria bacterium RBG_19FT_COMBO_42_43]